MDDEKKEVGYFKVTDRSLSEYEIIFDFRAEQLKYGSRILDIGSGTNQNLARNLKQKRPDIKVISLDPTLFLSKYDIGTVKGGKPSTDKERQQRKKQKFGEVVAAIFPNAPHLPFRDKSFDYIFDNHGPFMYFEDDFRVLRDYIVEIMRVLKPQGTVYIYPLDLLVDMFSGDILSHDQKEIYLKSENRILAIMGQLGREVPLEYHLFDFTEGTPQHPLIRKGIEIIKK